MAKKKSEAKPKTVKPRFGIAEWYGKSFVGLTANERKGLSEAAAKHRPKDKSTCPPCPFHRLPGGDFKPCWKRGGVCTLRLYKHQENGSAATVSGAGGKLVTVCPSRFHQDSIAFNWVGKTVLGADATPHVLDEVRFLRRVKGEESEDLELKPTATREDVGNIDNVLVHPKFPPFHWCALEIQAVYFSGEKMADLFTHVGNWGNEGIPFPDQTRRPDFRSSGPKRLMPQLQIKVPTLRRWGKKMAVVVDEQFFSNLGVMEEIPDPTDISNCDIVWFVVGFDESTSPITLKPALKCLTTLERAVEGLTNGIPVSLSKFENRISEKLSEGG